MLCPAVSLLTKMLDTWDAAADLTLMALSLVASSSILADRSLVSGKNNCNL